MSNSQPVAAAFGSDAWLRNAVATGLRHAGHNATDIGPGSASLQGVDVLVWTPSLLPRSRVAAKDVGSAALSMTLAAAASQTIRRTVLVTSIGCSKSAPSEYHDELALLERRAANNLGQVTAFRVTHPFGPAHDPGPVIKALMHHDKVLAAVGAGVRVQPIFVGDIVSAVDAAIKGLITPGAADIGGPEVTSLGELIDRARPAVSVRRRGWKRRRAATVEFLRRDSIVPRRHAPIELDLRTIAAVWGTG
jgi:hypothetical protein